MKTNIGNCEWCEYITEEENDILPESRYFWNECSVTPYDNLYSFPFKKTKCSHFKKREKKYKPSINLRLFNNFRAVWK